MASNQAQGHPALTLQQPHACKDNCPNIYSQKTCSLKVFFFLILLLTLPVPFSLTSGRSQNYHYIWAGKLFVFHSLLGALQTLMSLSDAGPGGGLMVTAGLRCGRGPHGLHTEATVGMMTFSRGLSHDPALEQTICKGYHGSKQLPGGTGQGSGMLHYHDKIHLQLVVFPLTFHMDKMNQFLISLLGFFLQE